MTNVKDTLGKDGEGLNYRALGKGKGRKILTVAKTITLPYPHYEYVVEVAESESTSFSSALSRLIQQGKAWRAQTEEEEYREWMMRAKEKQKSPPVIKPLSCEEELAKPPEKL